MTYSGVVATASASYTRISQQVLGSTTAQVDFTSIPNTYTSLELIISNATTNGNTTGQDTVLLRFNDATTGYWSEFHRFNANAVTSTANTAATSIPIGNAYGGGTSAPQVFGVRAIIHNYAKTTYRTVAAHSQLMYNSTATNYRNGLFQGTWTEVSNAINKVSIFCNSGAFITGSTFSLYGIS